MEKPEWTEALREFIAEARAARPAAHEAELTPLALQHRDLHAAVTAEFQQQANDTLEGRRRFHRDYPPDPIFVLTGDAAFLAAFRSMYPDDDILHGRGGRFF